MDQLKNFIERFREEFENETLPENHKGRFLSKLRKRSVNTKRKFMYYFTAACVALFLILTPILYLNRFYQGRDMNASDYIAILEERGKTITKMAETLNPQERDMVLSTLGQLTFEAVPFDSQLSDDIKSGKREELIKRFYSPRIEGVDELKRYVAQLNSEKE